MQNGKVILLAVLLLATAPLLLAQQPPAEKPMQMPMEHGAKANPMPDCQAMMQKMQQMDSKQKAMDDRLATLVADMNKAKGSAKVDRMAAVINELITQRKQMREQMSTMMPEMMNHMMEHMQMAMSAGMHSMENCPMMRNQQPDDRAYPKH